MKKKKTDSRLANGMGTNKKLKTERSLVKRRYGYGLTYSERLRNGSIIQTLNQI